MQKLINNHNAKSAARNHYKYYRLIIIWFLLMLSVLVVSVILYPSYVSNLINNILPKNTISHAVSHDREHKREELNNIPEGSNEKDNEKSNFIAASDKFENNDRLPDANEPQGEQKINNKDSIVSKLATLIRPNGENYEKNDQYEIQQNVSLMIIQFLQNQNFDQALLYVKKQKPLQVYHTLFEDLEKYSKLMKNPNKDNIKIFPLKNNFFEKMINIEKIFKIEKISNIEQERRKLQAKICEKLPTLIDYFFAQKFKQEDN